MHSSAASSPSGLRTFRENAGRRLAIAKSWRDEQWLEALVSAVDLMLNLVSAEPKVPFEELVGLRELRELLAPAGVPAEVRRCAWAVQFGLACLLGSEPMAAEVAAQLAEFLQRWNSVPGARFEPLGEEAPLRSWRDFGPAERGLLVREAGLPPEISERSAEEIGEEDLEWLDWWSVVKLGASLEEGRP